MPIDHVPGGRSLRRIVLAWSAIGWAAALPGAAALAQSGEPSALELALVDLDGRRELIARVPGIVFAPRIAPDESAIVFDLLDGANRQARIYVVPVARLRELGDLTEAAALASLIPLPLANDGPVNFAPAWTPDGERILFLDSAPDGDSVWWRNADGTGAAEKLLDARSAESWIDGDRLTVLTLASEGDYGISVLELSTGRMDVLIDIEASAQHSSHISPDGRFVAYASNETGRYEVYIEPLPRTGQRLALTTAGGGHPVWAPDGRSLYVNSNGRLIRYRIDPATGRPDAEAEALPIEGFVQGEYRRQFDMLPGGNRFLMLFPAAAD